MTIRRIPIPMLRPFVALVWASDSLVVGTYEQPVREHALPTGSMHLVFRLTDYPMRILGSDTNPRPQPVGSSVIGGVRSRFYIREMVAPSCSVGAVLRPGVAASLFGVFADQ